MARLTLIFRSSTTLAAAALLVSVAVLAQSSPQPASHSAQASGPEAAAPGMLTATLWSVDLKAKEIRVVTGVGHALRLMRLTLGEGCQIRHAGAAGRPEDLRPGGIVRVRYRGAGGSIAAQSIETVALEPGGGAP